MLNKDGCATDTYCQIYNRTVWTRGLAAMTETRPCKSAKKTKLGTKLNTLCTAVEWN